MDLLTKLYTVSILSSLDISNFPVYYNIYREKSIGRVD